MEIKINCLKWGNLYGSEYVNRSYGGLLKHCKIPFHFICYTDDKKGISSEIETRDIEELRPYNTKMVFTYEKLMFIEKEENDFPTLEIISFDSSLIFLFIMFLTSFLSFFFFLFVWT